MVLLQQAEKIFVVSTLFFSTTALIPLLFEDEGASSIPQDPLTPIVFGVIYLITIVLIIARRRVFVLVASKDILIWLLVGVALASVFWTAAPDLTPRRSGLLLGTTLFGVYFAMRYSFREQLHLLAWAFGTIVVLSFLCAIFIPSIGQMTFQEGGAHTGAWRGITTHKNLFGRLMNLSALVFLLLSLDTKNRQSKYHWVPWAGYILSVALIFLSTSKTALVVFITMTVIYPLYRALRQKYTVLIPFAIALVLTIGGTVTVLIANLEVVAKALGRDLTLTGRTDVWAVTWEMVMQRPLLGYGFNGFWRDWDSDITAHVWRILQWECPYAHNGFIDLAAELGLVGLGIFLLSFVTAYTRGVLWLRMTRNVEGILPLLYLTFLVMYNLTEGSLLATNSIFWILYVSIVFSIRHIGN